MYIYICIFNKNKTNFSILFFLNSILIYILILYVVLCGRKKEPPMRHFNINN